jgi:hypothetical protein
MLAACAGVSFSNGRLRRQRGGPDVAESVTGAIAIVATWSSARPPLADIATGECASGGPGDSAGLRLVPLLARRCEQVESDWPESRRRGRLRSG